MAARWTEPVCRGGWVLGNNCGQCQRCRAEAKAAIARAELLKALLGRLADEVENKGWNSLAARIRQDVERLETEYTVER